MYDTKEKNPAFIQKLAHILLFTLVVCVGSESRSVTQKQKRATPDQNGNIEGK